MNKFKSLIGGVALSVALATSALAAGVDINASSTGLAMQGYDPVAYFTVGEATKGDYRITALHDDALYRFSSEENKAAFEANPEAYLPAYGGYCAFGTAMGFKFDGDPNHWKIVDNKLYLNLSKDIGIAGKATSRALSKAQVQTGKTSRTRPLLNCKSNNPPKSSDVSAAECSAAAYRLKTSRFFLSHQYQKCPISKAPGVSIHVSEPEFGQGFVGITDPMTFADRNCLHK